MTRWVFWLLGLVVVGCKARPDVPASCSSAVCVGGEVEHNLAAAVPGLGEVGKVVLVEEGEHGTALIGVVGQDETRRILGLAMVSVDQLKGGEVVIPAGGELRFGQAQLWTIEDGRRTPLKTGQIRFSLDTAGRQLQASLQGESPEVRAEISGRYRLECKVPESVLNVQHRGVNAPGSETYTGDPGLDSEFCQKFRSMR